MSTSTPRPTLADAAAVSKTDPRKAEEILNSILDTPAGGQSIDRTAPTLSLHPAQTGRSRHLTGLVFLLQTMRMRFTTRRTHCSSSESSIGTRRESSGLDSPVHLDLTWAASAGLVRAS